MLKNWAALYTYKLDVNYFSGSVIYSRATWAMELSSNIISAMPSWSTSTSSMYTISVRARVFKLHAAWNHQSEKNIIFSPSEEADHVCSQTITCVSSKHPESRRMLLCSQKESTGNTEQIIGNTETLGIITQLTSLMKGLTLQTFTSETWPVPGSLGNSNRRVWTLYLYFST